MPYERIIYLHAFAYLGGYDVQDSQQTITQTYTDDDRG